MKKYLLLALLFFMFAGSAQASDFSVGIYPPILQIDANVPVAIRKDITVVNASEDSVTLDVVFKPFQQGPYQNGQVSYIPITSVRPDKDIFQKIQLLDENDNPVTSVTLGPKQKRSYTLHIGLPKDEPPGDYYFSVLFLSQDQVASANGSAIHAGIGANVLLSVGPKDLTTGFLDEFSAPWFVQTGPVPFIVSITNTSRHFISPTGEIYIRNMFGQLVGKVDLLSVNILEQSSRFIPSKDSPANAPRPLAIWPEKVLFGPYKANIVIALSDQGPIINKSIYFFAMPIQYIIGFFVVIIILSIIAARVKMRMRQN